MSQRTNPPFRADVVGSLLRPPALREAWASRYRRCARWVHASRSVARVRNPCRDLVRRRKHHRCDVALGAGPREDEV